MPSFVLFYCSNTAHNEPSLFPKNRTLQRFEEFLQRLNDAAASPSFLASSSNSPGATPSAASAVNPEEEQARADLQLIHEWILTTRRQNNYKWCRDLIADCKAVIFAPPHTQLHFRSVRPLQGSGSAVFQRVPPSSAPSDIPINGASPAPDESERSSEADSADAGDEDRMQDLLKKRQQQAPNRIPPGVIFKDGRWVKVDGVPDDSDVLDTLSDFGDEDKPPSSLSADNQASHHRNKNGGSSASGGSFYLDEEDPAVDAALKRGPRGSSEPRNDSLDDLPNAHSPDDEPATRVGELHPKGPGRPQAKAAGLLPKTRTGVHSGPSSIELREFDLDATMRRLFAQYEHSHTSTFGGCFAPNTPASAKLANNFNVPHELHLQYVVAQAERMHELEQQVMALLLRLQDEEGT